MWIVITTDDFSFFSVNAGSLSQVFLMQIKQLTQYIVLLFFTFGCSITNYNCVLSWIDSKECSRCIYGLLIFVVMYVCAFLCGEAYVWGL
jgi:hypothetical protein